MAPVLAVILEPEPVAGSYSFELISDDSLEQRARSVGSCLQHSSSPYVNVVQTVLVYLLRLLNRLTVNQSFNQSVVYLKNNPCITKC